MKKRTRILIGMILVSVAACSKSKNKQDISSYTNETVSTILDTISLNNKSLNLVLDELEYTDLKEKKNCCRNTFIHQDFCRQLNK